MIMGSLGIHVQTIIMDSYLMPYTKINSQGIKGLKVRPKTTKVLQEIIGEKYQDTGFGSDFLDVTLKAQAIK